MFGFIRPYIPELKNREHVFYKSVYCGLCRTMKAHLGVFSCMTLSYDLVFLALVRLAATGEAYTIRRERCMRHPFRNRAVMQETEFLRFSARVGAVLVRGKCEDNKADEKGFSRFCAASALPLANRFCRLADYPEACDIIAQRLSALSEAEKAASTVPDECAELFGQLLGEIAALDLPEACRRPVFEMGRHVGRFIYLADALCDYRKDRKKGRYNPFCLSLDEEEMRLFIEKEADNMLASELQGALSAFDLLTVRDETAVALIHNILWFGMKNTFRTEMGKEWLT